MGLICHGGTETGNERYMVELVRALLGRNDGLRYSVFYTREATRRRLTVGGGAIPTFHRLVPEIAFIRVPIVLPWAIRKSGVSLVHGQYGLPPFVKPPAVVTVHDVFVAEHPEMYPPIQRLQLLQRIPRALESAMRVIVPSESTKRAIMERYSVDAAKVTVIPLGVAARFRCLPDATLATVRERLSLPPRFILYVGALQPRKNVARLITAYGRLPSTLRHSYPLIIGGTKGWMYEALHQALATVANEGTVRLIGYLSDDDLPAVMNLATVFAFPSLSEGFGFPVVEAMRCGACVLAGNAGSLPEIVRDAGILVDPTDTSAIMNGLCELLENSSLRETLRTRGEARAAEYTWDRTAAATVAVYREVMDQ